MTAVVRVPKIILIAVAILFGIPLLFSLLAAAVLRNRGDGYDFPVDPPETYELGLSRDALATRLDESGMFHGAHEWTASTSSLLDISLDNDCRVAVVEVISRPSGSHVIVRGFDVEKRCREGTNLDELLGLFEREVLGRLGGSVAPQAVTESDGARFDYPPDTAPFLLVRGTVADLARRLDASGLLHHEFHDGVYELGEGACFGRFRVSEEPDGQHTRITGVGYSTPCAWGTDQDCLSQLFRIAIQRPDDPTPPPAARTGSNNERSSPTPLCELFGSGAE
jgi:hypothetical protein